MKKFFAIFVMIFTVLNINATASSIDVLDFKVKCWVYDNVNYFDFENIDDGDITLVFTNDIDSWKYILGRTYTFADNIFTTNMYDKVNAFDYNGEKYNGEKYLVVLKLSHTNYDVTDMGYVDLSTINLNVNKWEASWNYNELNWSMYVNDNTTAVNNVESNVNVNKTYKIVENGKVVIVKNGIKYNTNGTVIK